MKIDQTTCGLTQTYPGGPDVTHSQIPSHQPHQGDFKNQKPKVGIVMEIYWKYKVTEGWVRCAEPNCFHVYRQMLNLPSFFCVCICIFICICICICTLIHSLLSVPQRGQPSERTSVLAFLHSMVSDSSFKTMMKLVLILLYLFLFYFVFSSRFFIQ